MGSAYYDGIAGAPRLGTSGGELGEPHVVGSQLSIVDAMIAPIHNDVVQSVRAGRRDRSSMYANA